MCTTTIIMSILSSTVLATIFSSIVTYLNYNKELRLKRITDERTKWRESIRNVANELIANEHEKREKVLLALTKLQLLINTNGKFDNTDIMSDGHIWQLIDEIKKEEVINQEKTELLVLYLSALLKFDWERAKVEVSKRNCNNDIKESYKDLVKKIQKTNNNACVKEETI